MVVDGQTVYLDESGFTGNRLLDVSQPVFVYASVALEEAIASDICTEVGSRFQIGHNELKGSNLIKHHKGRAAIAWLLNRLREVSHVMVIDKEYAAACRFFEYIYEPILSKESSLFYSIEFHRYMAATLYMLFKAGDSYAKQMMDSFEDLMVTLNVQHLQSVLFPASSGNIPLRPPLNEMLALARYHQERIAEEITVLQETRGASSWPLELSVTSLHYLLATWGEEFESLSVFCDSSKPVQAYLPVFNNFVGRTDKFYISFGRYPTPSLVYNLARPIALVDSKTSPGIQLADVLASAIAYALKNRGEEISQSWLETIDAAIVNNMQFDPVLLNPDGQEYFLNTLVLLELLSRSASGEDLFEGMDEFILSARHSYYLSRFMPAPPGRC